MKTKKQTKKFTFTEFMASKMPEYEHLVVHLRRVDKWIERKRKSKNA
jgi:hypothetical protein